MNKYIDISNSLGTVKTVRATGVAAVAIDQSVLLAKPIVIQYTNGSKVTISPLGTDFTDDDALKVAKAIIDTASTNWREVSSTFSETLSVPINAAIFTF